MALRFGLTSRLRSTALGAPLAAMLAATFVAVPADDAAAKTKTKAPVVTSTAPDRMTIGERLTIRGRNFRAGKGRNTVVFRRDGARAVFVRADLSTRKVMRVTLPAKLADHLAVEDGTPQFTRFRIRILSQRLGRRFTSVSASPVIGPEKPPAPPAPPASSADGDCDTDGVLNGVDGDDDNDLLDDATESRLRTDSCKLDSDGDEVGDGYEFQSALHLNNDEYQDPNNSLPYPEKRPYPNALFADGHLDFDGDGLTLGEEHQLWRATGDPAAGLGAVNYSDGLQYTIHERYSGDRRRGSLLADAYGKHADFLSWAGANGYLTVMLGGVESRDIRDANRDGTVAETADLTAPGVYYASERYYFDFDSDGRLSDDERDEDADGLTNYDESHGRLLPAYWTGCYAKEKAYPIPYGGTDLVDPDTDGDGVRDGADDQDHDDIPNLMEMSRNAASGRAYNIACSDRNILPSPSPAQGWVNPFNPCLPDPASRTCARHPELGSAYPPFDASLDPYLVLN